MNPAPAPLGDRLRSCPGYLAGNVLDVRPAGDFEAGHLAGSVNFPLDPAGHPAADRALPGLPPASQLVALLERQVPSIFLPPRHEPLLVVDAEYATAAACAAALQGRGRAEVQALALTEGWQDALPPETAAVGPGQGHLWRPPEWLVRHELMLPPPAAGPVLDLACGSGRAAVWLAVKGYRVTGLDWQPDALALGSRLAASCRVNCRFVPADLRRPENPPAGPWSVVTAFRYLQRDLLSKFAGLLVPGGVALVRTFRLAPGSGGRPHPRHRLQAGELPGFFAPPHFEILAHEESWDADGRPAAGIVARRTGAV